MNNFGLNNYSHGSSKNYDFQTLHARAKLKTQGYALRAYVHGLHTRTFKILYLLFRAVLPSLKYSANLFATRFGPRAHGNVYLHFCIVSSNELVVLDSLENSKQYKNEGKRFRVYGALDGIRSYPTQI